MKASTQNSYRARIDRALAWLDAHKHEDVRPADLARVAHFSAHHFHRVFRGLTGESVMECIRRLRLESAAKRLRQTRASVLEVALESGFQSHEGFTRAFRSHFGITPIAFREQPDPRIARAASVPALSPADVQVRVAGPISLVCLGHQGSFDDIPEVWERFVAQLQTLGLYSTDAQLVGRYPDDPEITPPGLVRFDVALRSDDPRPLPPPLFRRQIPAGTWGVTVHEGSYDTLEQTYLRLVGGWFPSTGTRLGDGPCLEFYLNDPNSVSSDQLLTEVWAPIV